MFCWPRKSLRRRGKKLQSSPKSKGSLRFKCDLSETLLPEDDHVGVKRSLSVGGSIGTTNSRHGGGCGSSEDSRNHQQQVLLFYSDELDSVCSSVPDFFDNEDFHYKSLWGKDISEWGGSSVSNLATPLKYSKNLSETLPPAGALSDVGSLTSSLIKLNEVIPAPQSKALSLSDHEEPSLDLSNISSSYVANKKDFSTQTDEINRDSVTTQTVTPFVLPSPLSIFSPNSSGPTGPPSTCSISPHRCAFTSYGTCGSTSSGGGFTEEDFTNSSLDSEDLISQIVINNLKNLINCSVAEYNDANNNHDEDDGEDIPTKPCDRDSAVVMSSADTDTVNNNDHFNHRHFNFDSPSSSSNYSPQSLLLFQLEEEISLNQDRNRNAPATKTSHVVVPSSHENLTTTQVFIGNAKPGSDKVNSNRRKCDERASSPASIPEDDLNNSKDAKVVSTLKQQLLSLSKELEAERKASQTKISSLEVARDALSVVVQQQASEALHKEQQHQQEIQNYIEQIRSDKCKDFEDLQTELNRERECHAEELAAVNREHAGIVETLVADYSEALAVAKRESDEVIGKLRKEHVEEVEKLKEAFRLELEEVRKSHKEVINAHKNLSPHELLIKEIQSLEVVVEMRNNEIRALRTDLVNYKATVEELKDSQELVRTLYANKEDLNAQIEKSRKDKAVLQEKIQQLESQIESLESEKCDLSRKYDQLCFKYQN